jgi:hypothetical protein
MQDVPPSEASIERAIRAGTQALVGQCRVDSSLRVNAVNADMGYDYCGLVLYALVHSGVYTLEDDTVKALLGRLVAAPMLRTYQVAMTAAALAAVDPVKYQAKLAQCAQYLLDHQCDNGQWGYGERYESQEYAASTGDGGTKKTIAKIRIARVKKLGPLVGDNSNSQYAALGLKACAAGACEIESAAVSRAIEWWERSQVKGGGWSYHGEGVYQEPLGSYGSMTAGAVSSLIMLKQIKNSDPKLSPAVTRGLSWLADNFTVERNAKAPPDREEWLHYYLYALERVGDLLPTEKIGRRSWYAIGATFLIQTQKPSGLWEGPDPGLTIADTCFALLFLERAARRPPVATGGKVDQPAPK